MAQTEPGTATPAVSEDFDISSRDDIDKLHKGAVGLGGVLFLTVTGAAPIAAMLFNPPILVGYGEGLGAPAGFLVATIVLVIFSVGYVARARKQTSAGGFYSYISHGLGRELGFGAGSTPPARNQGGPRPARPWRSRPGRPAGPRARPGRGRRPGCGRRLARRRAWRPERVTAAERHAAARYAILGCASSRGRG